jgi:hypothetical protein
MLVILASPLLFHKQDGKWAFRTLVFSVRELIMVLPPHRKVIERLNAQYLKLQNRIDQMYLDKLDGEIKEAFYKRHVNLWREE